MNNSSIKAYHVLKNHSDKTKAFLKNIIAILNYQIIKA
jgi:hypothetical protein